MIHWPVFQSVKTLAVLAWSFFAAVIFLAEQSNVYIPLWIALIVAIPSTFTPLMMAWFQQRSRIKEKEMDWKRQDEVAKKVEEVKKASAEVAVKVEAVKKASAEVAVKVQEVKDASDSRTVQLDSLKKGQEMIHSLVDGQMTAALQSELDSKMIAVTLMRELMDLRKGEPSAETTATLKAMQDSIDDLKKRLEARRAIEAKMKEKE